VIETEAGSEGTLVLPPRVLGVAEGELDGPTLIAIGGVHGNEPAGVAAILAVLESLRSDPASLKGEFVGLTGNRIALAKKRRFVDIDLNRLWSYNGSGPGPIHRAETARDAVEVREQIALQQAIVEAGKRAKGPVFVVDLHTTSGHGPGFTAIGDTLANRSFAAAIPVPLVLGLEELVDGTLLEFLDESGFVSTVFEIGQHEEEVAARRGVAGLLIALGQAGLLDASRDSRVHRARRYLAAETRGLPPVVEMRRRHPVLPDDGFQMLPGFRNFQPISDGEVLAHDQGGPILANGPARILMPLYQELGEDGFFVIREIKPFWLKVSSVLRRMGVCRLIPLLPGVRFRDKRRGVVEINKRVARFYALQVFHLLGYRKRRDDGEHLLMIRRGFDVGAPNV
jgi:succinylglutamate desuccinylase